MNDFDDFFDSYRKDIWPPIAVSDTPAPQTVTLTDGRETDTVRAGSNFERVLLTAGWRYVKQLERQT